MHLYEKTGSPIELIISFPVESRSEIKALATNSAENMILAGCQDGTISVYDLGVPGRERLVKLVFIMQGRRNVRCL